MNNAHKTILACATVLAFGAFAMGSAFASSAKLGAMPEQSSANATQQGIYDVHGRLTGFAPSSTNYSVRADVGPAVTTVAVYDVHGSLIGFEPADRSVRADAGGAVDGASPAIATVGVYDVHGSLIGFAPANK